MNYIEPKFEAKQNKQNEETDLYIYGTIGGSFWFGGVSSKDIRSTLSTIKTPVINVHIHSNGGDAFEGVAICNLLKNHNATINIYIDGVAASAASVIAMAGDKIIMPKNTMIMVHRAACFCYGNAQYLQKQADTLAKVDEALIESYTDRFKGEQLELERLLDEETWLTAKEAEAYGLCDEIAEPIKEANGDSEEAGEEGEEEPVEEPILPEDNNMNRFAAMAKGFSLAAQKINERE